MAIPGVQSNQVGPVPEFEEEFKSSVAEKEQKWSEKQKWSESRLGTHFADGLDRIL